MSYHNADLRHAVRYLRSTLPRLLEHSYKGGAVAGQNESMESAFRRYRPGINRQPRPQGTSLPSTRPPPSGFAELRGTRV